MEPRRFPSNPDSRFPAGSKTGGRKPDPPGNRPEPRPGRVYPFTKFEATGNDFILFDLYESSLSPNPLVSAPAVQKLCRRRTGIGADGILLVLPGQKARFRMRIFNSDGSEAEMCGNGLRAVVSYLRDRGMFSGERVEVETLAGIKSAHIRGRTVTIVLGRPRALPGTPIRIENQMLEPFNVDVGNPHAVLFINGEVDKYPVGRLGPQIENHPAFPHRTNVEFVRIRKPGELEARVWERGVGETPSCGTGAGAIFFAAFSLKKSPSQARVFLPGGELKLDLKPDGLLHLSGPAQEVFSGRVNV